MENNNILKALYGMLLATIILVLLIGTFSVYSSVKLYNKMQPNASLSEYNGLIESTCKSTCNKVMVYCPKGNRTDCTMNETLPIYHAYSVSNNDFCTCAAQGSNSNFVFDAQLKLVTDLGMNCTNTTNTTCDQLSRVLVVAEERRK